MYFPASHFSPAKVQKRLNTNCWTVACSRKKGEGVPSAGDIPRQLCSGDFSGRSEGQPADRGLSLFSVEPSQTPSISKASREAAGPDTRLNPPSPSLGGCRQAPRSARHQRSQEAASKLFVFPDNGSLSCCFPALGAWSDPAPVRVTAQVLTAAGGP